MTLHGQRATRRRLGPRRAVLAMLALLAAVPGPAAAQEPLFIRIRPQPEPGSTEAGRAAREALWARRQAHARAVIESVCTGCLGAWAPPDPPPPPQMTALAAASSAPEGLESDPASGASEPTSEPSTSERRP